MSLFSIETAPVPLDAETYLGEKREYTQIIPETELVALTENNYIPLTQAQILLCAKIGYMYYCEYAHLLKKCTEHTCMSAIYVVRRRGRLAPHQPLSVCALLPAPREEQASAASWEPRPPFEAAEMD